MFFKVYVATPIGIITSAQAFLSSSIVLWQSLKIPCSSESWNLLNTNNRLSGRGNNWWSFEILIMGHMIFLQDEDLKREILSAAKTSKYGPFGLLLVLGNQASSSRHLTTLVNTDRSVARSDLAKDIYIYIYIYDGPSKEEKGKFVIPLCFPTLPILGYLIVFLRFSSRPRIRFVHISGRQPHGDHFLRIKRDSFVVLITMLLLVCSGRKNESRRPSSGNVTLFGLAM
ncbi:hypothetical protein TorRG33x02_287850 [Trema orientale]|uniref:Uncharacterized protein n=1 Tax=Trema orientale TaxID=63057 RepID=A0A2P5CEV4_TREOI|nr:hypothetical protein TorRG33x02_287850 [Trema orientale]